jgi:flagellin-like protein
MTKMMKFFRKHKKAVSPVIAVMLLVAVAVAAVGAYFIWFRSFQTQTQKSVQETSEGALGGGLQVVSFTDDGQYYYVNLKNTMASGSIQITGVRVNPPAGATCNTTFTDVEIAPGSTKTYVLRPSFTMATGTTRTFTIEANSATIVITTTYADS